MFLFLFSSCVLQKNFEVRCTTIISPTYAPTHYIWNSPHNLTDIKCTVNIVWPPALIFCIIIWSSNRITSSFPTFVLANWNSWMYMHPSNSGRVCHELYSSRSWVYFGPDCYLIHICTHCIYKHRQLTGFDNRNYLDRSPDSDARIQH
jgi:hypothetical protein